VSPPTSSACVGRPKKDAPQFVAPDDPVMEESDRGGACAKERLVDGARVGYASPCYDVLSKVRPQSAVRRASAALAIGSKRTGGSNKLPSWLRNPVHPVGKSSATRSSSQYRGGKTLRPSQLRPAVATNLPSGRYGGHHRRSEWWLGETSEGGCAQLRMRSAPVFGSRSRHGCKSTCLWWRRKSSLRDSS